MPPTKICIPVHAHAFDNGYMRNVFVTYCGLVGPTLEVVVMETHAVFCT